MFQKKIDELFSNMSNVFGIADHILTIGALISWARTTMKH